MPFINSSTIAKVVAVLKAVALCKDLGFQRVILEGDALEIVQALRRFVAHIRREANEAAHSLAKAALH